MTKTKTMTGKISNKISPLLWQCNELSFVVKESTRKNERDKVTNLVYIPILYIHKRCFN